MKQLLLGNAAVARGAWEAGVSVASSYPGTPSTEITASLAGYDEIYTEWAPNEKVAMETAWGASLAGVRSFTGMKHVGLNVAADTLFTISYTGVNAGMVCAVADEPGMHSSQNEQDSRHYARAAKVPMLEVSDSSECLEYTKYAYELSEKYDTPVLLRTCTRVAHSQSIVETSERAEPPVKKYEKNPQKYVMMPSNAIKRHPIVEQRTQQLRDLAEDTFLNRVEWRAAAAETGSAAGSAKTAETGSAAAAGESEHIGIITSGTCYQYVKEVFGDTVSVLKLGLVYPLPVKLITDFAAKTDRLIVIEELDPYLEEHCKILGLDVTGKLPDGDKPGLFPICGELSPNLIAEKLSEIVSAKEQYKGSKQADSEEIPVRPPVMCPGCSHRGLFYVLGKIKATVLGDIGCYTLGAAPPLGAMDTTTCMGASISGIHGFMKANAIAGDSSGSNAVCVIGDSTFAHMGINGLINVGYNRSDSTIIITDNSTTGMTGHQNNPTNGLDIKGEPCGRMDIEAVCKACGIDRVKIADPNDLEYTERVIREEIAAPGPSVIIARRPCMLLKTSKPKPPLAVDADKCKSCRACMKLGCPALAFKEKKAVINATLCVGCDVCKQLCKWQAIS